MILTRESSSADIAMKGTRFGMPTSHELLCLYLALLTLHVGKFTLSVFSRGMTCTRIDKLTSCDAITFNVKD
jgi:hypothetical protein